MSEIDRQVRAISAMKPGSVVLAEPPLEAALRQSSVMSSVRIRSTKEEPAFPYRVQHRGYCFYVDDADINSRVFLEAMVAAYSSRVGSKLAGGRHATGGHPGWWRISLKVKHSIRWYRVPILILSGRLITCA